MVSSGTKERELTWERVQILIRQHTVEVSDPSLPERPKVSVPIITFNHACFIAQTLEGALKQQVNFPYEIIVGDDHSTDSTTEIVLDYQKRFPGKIKVLLASENLGKYTGNGRLNFIRTLAACRGEYLAILEGDDYWTDPRKLALQVEFLDQNQACALCHHKVHYVQWPGDEKIREFPPRRYRTPTLEPHSLALLNCIQTCSVLIRREWMPPFDEEFVELRLADWPLFVLLSQRGWIGYLDRNMACYRVHAANVWNNRPADFKLQALRKMAEYLLARVNENSKDLWKDTILAIAFKDVAIAARSLSPGKFWQKLVYFAGCCGKFKKPFWVFNRLWIYYRAHNLAD
jgi:glycosyltransferase involved in cell wall biosynthesis